MVSSSGTLMLITTFIIGLFLEILPLPDIVEWWRPSWMLMTIIYWTMALPSRVGIIWAWIFGLIIDVSLGTHLGVHGCTYAITAYLVLSLSNRLRLFTLWQQSLFVALLVGFDLVVSLWIENFIEYRYRPATYWLPMISSALIWPISFISLRYIRRSFRIQ